MTITSLSCTRHRPKSNCGQKRIEPTARLDSKLQEERFETLDGLMQHLMLLDILDRQEQEQDAIQLITLHSAKGLEFPVVYIAGCEEELLPHRNSMDSDDGEREERRLLYVGMTRAKETLLLSYAKRGGAAPNYKAPNQAVSSTNCPPTACNGTTAAPRLTLP